MDLLKLQICDPSKAELAALSVYKSAADGIDGRSQCFALNRLLEHSLYPDEMGTLGSIANTLDGVFERCPRLSAPLTVYRAIGFRSHLPVAEFGARFRNRSYWSTSTHREAAIGFLKAEFQNAGGAVLHLELPSGLPAYNMETLIGAGGSEFELLLPRGVLWKVGTANPFDMSRALLPHVAKQFSGVVEVTLTASPQWRTA